MQHNASLGLFSMDIDVSRKFCCTHTYADDLLQIEAISSYFVHVTWLDLEIQALSCRRVLDRFSIQCRPSRGQDFVHYPLAVFCSFMVKTSAPLPLFRECRCEVSESWS